MSDERMKILNMLSDGKINTEEADKLLGALNEKKVNSVEVTSDGLPKYLHVVVDSEENKVNIKVPLALLKAGVNLASLMPQEVMGEVNTAMEDKGFNFNLSDIKKENLDEIILALNDLEIDVNDGDAKIRVYCS